MNQLGEISDSALIACAKSLPNQYVTPFAAIVRYFPVKVPNIDTMLAFGVVL